MRGFKSILASAVLAGALAACGGSEKTEVEVGSEQSADPAPGRNINPAVEVAPNIDVQPAEEPVRDPTDILGQMTPILATGSEPFWTLEIGTDWIVFNRPGLPLIEVPMVDPEQTEKQAQLASGEVSITVVQEACNGDADGRTVRLTFEEVEYLGCVGAADGPGALTEPEMSAWVGSVETHVDAIDVCLEAAGRARLVRNVFPREEGVVGILLSDQFGQLQDCGVETETSTLLFINPLGAGGLDGFLDGNAAFLRTGQDITCKGRAGDQIGDNLGRVFPQGC